jgi:iron complex outermembrane recepter protein
MLLDNPEGRESSTSGSIEMAHSHSLPLALALAGAAAAAGGPVHADSVAELDEIVVGAAHTGVLPTATLLGRPQLESARARTSDSAALLKQLPGISLYGAGGVSSLPAIRGLADNRVRIKLDGMDLTASCPNHMNPPLSYVDPNAIGSVAVYAGIVPVSLAGDSIGGSIVVETLAPELAAPGATLLRGALGGYYRSNGDAYGANVAGTAANEHVSLSYAGALSNAGNYSAAREFKTTTATGRLGHTLPLDEVGSTAYETESQRLGFAWRRDNHLLTAQVSYQDVPKQLYPNQRMDMLGNEATQLNLRYSGDFGWGRLAAQAFYETVDHFMDFGPDKRFWYGRASGMMAMNGMPCAPIGGACAAGMPMYSESKTLGLGLVADLDLSDRHLLRLGAEYRGYELDDWWPPSGAAMWPGTFDNINDGQRDRFALFGELEMRPAADWLALLGVRYERVDMDTGDVMGYSTAPSAPGNQATEALAFNARDRARTDGNLNLSLLAQYRIDATKRIELGYAHLVRSPSLYERYTWSSWTMAAIMNNTVGDGNGYIGDIDLAPEQADTVALTFAWQSPDETRAFQATPYYTRVTDYIDAVPYNAATWRPNQFNVLRYANQDAELYGIDVAGRLPLGAGKLGRFGLAGLLGYTRGQNLDTDAGLYNIMPLNLTLTLSQALGGWDNALEVALVDTKDDLSTVRNEIETPGYALVNLRASYAWPKLRLDFGVENLLDRMYDLPLGGAYVGQGRTMVINPTDGTLAWGTAVPGAGRSFYVGFNLRF